MKYCSAVLGKTQTFILFQVSFKLKDQVYCYIIKTKFSLSFFLFQLKSNKVLLFFFFFPLTGYALCGK